MVNAGWNNIPDELKARRQWCVANINLPKELEPKAPRIVGTNGALASSTDPRTWSSYDEAVAFAAQRGWAIGFILTADSNLCCIDLDIKDERTHPDKPELWTSQETMDMYWQMVQEVDSFTEISIGGKALHIWVKANIGAGVRYKGVEFYSQERFIVVTGNTIWNRPIEDRNEFINASVRNIRAMQSDSHKFELVEVEEEDTDEEIYERAINAGNGAKFFELCEGRWEQYGYPSQSEAELSLLSMFTFYSPSNEQVKRLFRYTKLAAWDTRKNVARTKVHKDDRYLNFSLRLIRARQARDEAIDTKAIAQSLQVMLSAQETPAPVAVPLALPTAATPVPVAIATPTVHAPVVPTVVDTGIAWPPGITGHIARFIYNSAPRPVKEVAIVTALGFLAGVAGKAYSVPKSGLNLYIVLVAKSAIGKEAMNSGMSAIMASLRNRNPSAMRFVDFSDFASGPALRKACLTNPSFVNVNGEWGKKLKRLSKEDGRDQAMDSLRTAMTDLYQKSGPQSIVGGMVFSDKDKNVMSVSGVAYSMIGETTPSTYYQSLTESMMEDGFLSRFTMLEYTGERPPLNESPLDEPDKVLADHICDLCVQALTLNSRGDSCFVNRDVDATKIFKDFEIENDNNINGADLESWRQMYNRASLKALRIAAILAVADNYVHPIITRTHAEWAIGLIRRDIALMTRRMDDGDIGNSDTAREKKLLSIIATYSAKVIPDSYGVPDSLRLAGIIPRKYLIVRVGPLNIFNGHRAGSSVALDITIKSLIDSGYLLEVAKDKLVEKHGFVGRCFRVLDLPKHGKK